MLLIGLTGSIATGKSTVSSLLSSPPHHLHIIDADLLARKVVEPGTRGYRRVLRELSHDDNDSILLPATENVGGARPLDRAALGRMVFGDSEETRRRRAVLNSIVHPAVRWKIYKALLYHYLCGCRAVVLDVPLLFESGLDLICGTVVVVAMADAEGQVRRLMGRDPALSVDEAWARVGSQWDVREKAVRCEWRNGDPGAGTRGVVVWNDGSKGDLKEKVDDMVGKIRRASPSWWSWSCLLLPPVGLVVAMWHMAWNLRDKWAWERGQEAKAGSKDK